MLVVHQPSHPQVEAALVLARQLVVQTKEGGGEDLDMTTANAVAHSNDGDQLLVAEMEAGVETVVENGGTPHPLTRYRKDENAREPPSRLTMRSIPGDGLQVWKTKRRTRFTGYLVQPRQENISWLFAAIAPGSKNSRPNLQPPPDALPDTLQQGHHHGVNSLHRGECADLGFTTRVHEFGAVKTYPCVLGQLVLVSIP